MKYDPDRRYKRGDLVRITGYRGRRGYEMNYKQ